MSEKEISIPNVEADSGDSMYAYEQNSIHHIEDIIDAKKDEEIETYDTNELVDFFIEDYLLPEIEEDTTKEPIIEPIKTYARKDQNFFIKYPIVLKPGIDKTISLSVSSRILHFEYMLENGNLVTLVRIPLTAENPEHAADDAIRCFRETRDHKNADVKRHNDMIKQAIRTHLQRRKERIAQQGKLFDKIKKRSIIRLVRNEQAPQVDLKVKKKLKVLKPKEKNSKPYLPEESLNAVTDLILNQGRSFQLTPKVFSTLDEVSLRDIILSMLNAILEGGALGETFVKTRRSDIYLKLEGFDGQILTGECKYWNSKPYQDAMNQHFDYITTQEGYSLQITFSKNKNFSEVVEKASQYAQEHQTYIEGSYRKVNENYFVTKHKHPEDDKKIVEFHHLLFNLYFERQDV